MSKRDKRNESRWGLKLPHRYWWDMFEMQDSLIKRLLRTTSPNLKRARYAAMYGASWGTIVNKLYRRRFSK